MAIYTVRLAAAASTGAGFTTLFTAPSGQVTVIRDMIIDNESGGVTIGQIGISGGNVLMVNSAMANQSFLHEECRIVIEPGETVYGFAGAAGVQFTVTGYALT